ncbi:MAG: GntR family transcriptional regulator [[Bacteroides] pectinophilus]|nr:GntR family transcriptional regulator [[Bacteroides] pectinophilus]
MNKYTVSEAKLSKELGISRTPMREALQCLSQDGYITVVPSKGFRIRQLNQKDMKETIQIRCAIEGFCTQCLAADVNTARGQKTIRELGNILDLQRHAVEGRVTGTMDEHAKYYEYLKNGNGNDAYKVLIDHLMMPLNVVKTTK